MAKWVYLMHSPQWQLTNSFSWMLTERKTRAAVRARPSKYEDSPFTPPGTRVIGCFLITVLAIVNFISRPFWNIGAVAMTHISPVDWVLYTSLAWQWWIAEAPLIFSGLSMMKLPFHTMERSTARSLIFTPSYMYWKAEKQRVRECGKWIQTKRKLKWERGLSKKKMIQRKTEWRKMRGMKGQKRDKAFNHLSFLPWLSAPLLFDMWGRKPWLGWLIIHIWGKWPFHLLSHRSKVCSAWK